MKTSEYEYTIVSGDARRKTWAGLLLTTLSNRRMLRYSLLAVGVVVVAVVLIIWGGISAKIIGAIGVIGPCGVLVVLFRSAANMYRSNQETYAVGTVLAAGFDESGYWMRTSRGRGLRLPFSKFRVTRAGWGYVRIGSRIEDDPSACFVPRQVFPRDRVEWFNSQGGRGGQR